MKNNFTFIFKTGIVSILMAILIFSCKKEESDIVVSGNVVDPQNGSVIAGAHVYLDGKILSGGIYNDNYSEIASTTTDASGHFELKTPWQVVSEYRIRVFKNNYFDNQSIVAAESIPKGGTYTNSFSLLPAAWVRLNINNVVGYNTDEIMYKYAQTPQSCMDCCTNQFLTGSGNYHAIYKCKAVGNKYNKFYWTVKRNDIINPFSDSVYCPAFDTTTLNISY